MSKNKMITKDFVNLLLKSLDEATSLASDTHLVTYHETILPDGPEAQAVAQKLKEVFAALTTGNPKDTSTLGHVFK